MNSRPVFFRISRNRKKAASAPSTRPKALSGSIAKYSRGLVLSALALIGASQAPGATYYWDQNGGTAGTGGTGNWETSSSFWRLDSDTGTLGTWPTSGTTNAAVFGGTAGTVTLTTGISANSLTFNTTGYSLTNSGAQTLTLNGTTPTITVASGVTATIGAATGFALAGTNGLTVAGPGILILGGASTTQYTGLTGGITVTGAMLELDLSTGANGISDRLATSNTLTLNGGQIFAVSINGTGANIRTQTFAGLTFSGGSSVTPYQYQTAGSGNTMTVALNGITRNSAGSILFQRVIGGTSTFGIASTTTANTNSILGPWAFYNEGAGSGTPDRSWRYATNSGVADGVSGSSGSKIEGLAGSTVTNADSFTDATANYNFSGAVTLAASRTANTARYTGTSLTTTTIPTGTTLTLNGLLNGGTSSAGTLSSSVLTIASSGTGALAIGGTNELVVAAGANNIAISAPITGGSSGGGLTIMGYNSSSLVTLSGANTYSGKTTINAGALVLGAAGVIPDTSDVTIASSNIGIQPTSPNSSVGVLNLNGNSETIGSLSGTGTVTTAVAGSITLTVGASNVGSATFSGVIQNPSGTVALTKTGSGIQTLSGTNTYTGNTLVSVGTLQLAKQVSLYNNGAAAAWSKTNINVNSGATMAFNIGGTGEFTNANILTLLGLADATTNGFKTGAILGLDTTSGDVLFNSVIANPNSGTNVLGLTKLGTNKLTLDQANTYTGVTKVSNGILKLNGAAVNNTTILTDGSTATTSDIVINGGTLELALSEQIANSGSINMTSGAFNFGAATGKTETIDKFTNSGGTFTTGANTLIGLGNTITWSGGTNTVNNGGNVQDLHIVISGGTNTVEGGATGGVLQLNASGTGLEMSNGSTLTLNSDNTVAGKLLLKGNVSTSGDSTVTIASGLALTNKGNIDLDGGTRTFTVANGAAATDMSISAVITNGSMIKDGAGTLSLSAANTYTGTTTISAGTLQFANQVSLYNNTTASWTAANIKVGSGATLGLNVGGTGEFTTANITTLLTNLGGLGGAVSNNGLQAGSTIAFYTTNASGGNFTVADNIANSNGTGGGAIGLTKLGTNTLTLNGTNTYSGGTTLNAGTLSLGNNSALGSGTLTINDGAIDVTGARVITNALSLGNSFTFLGSGSNTLTQGTGAVTLTATPVITVAASTLTLGGNIASGSGGTFGITKAGAGTLILTGANTYAGQTMVNAGTLSIQGASGALALSSSPVIVFGTFQIDNTSNSNSVRIADTQAFSLLDAGVIKYLGNTSSASSETIGDVTVTGNRLATITVTNGNLTANSLARSTGQSAVLVNGTSLGKDSATASTSVGRLILTTTPTLVGNTAALTTGINSAAKDTKIVPYLVGESGTSTGNLGTQGGTANTFLTYISGTGLRPLNPIDEFTNNAITAGNNTRITSATTAASTAAINSLVISGANLSINNIITLTNTSGALLFASSNAIQSTSGVGTLDFGSAEAMVTVNTNFTGTISANLTGSGGLTFSSSVATPGALALTGGSTGFSGPLTISANAGAFSVTTTAFTIAANSTWMNYSSNSPTISAPITYTGKLTLGGRGTWILTGASTSGTGGMAVGDGTTFSGNGVGGKVQVSSQNALGSGTITVNYGGVMKSFTEAVNTVPNSTAFAPTNAITVNNGGTLWLFGAITPVGLITLNSGATLQSVPGGGFGGGATGLTQGTNVSFPTAGVFFNALGVASTVSNAYPTFTGTLAFGGSSSVTLTTAATTTVSSATTLAFNQYSTLDATVAGLTFNGLVLNADLKVAGSGLNIGMGSIPLGSAGRLGNITNGGTAKNIVVEMSPLGIASVTGSNGWANTTINSGTLESSGTNTGSGALGSGTLTLNGGTLRITGTTSKDITVGTNGGVIETVTAPQTYSGTVIGTSSAGLVLRSGIGIMTVSGTFNSFNGNITLATANRAQPIDLGASSLVLPNTSFSVIVPSGIAFSGTVFTSNPTRFNTQTDSIFIPGAVSVDLSAAGKDVSIGLNGTAPTGYTPFGSTYRLVPLFTTTLASSIFSGANDLNFSAPANITDSNSFIRQTFGNTNTFATTVTITASQSYTGTTTVAGNILPAGYGGDGNVNLPATPATLVVQNTLLTTRIDVQRAGSFTVNGALGAVASATTINVSGSTFTSGDTGSSNYNRLSDSAVITLGGNSGIASGGGTFVFANNTTTGTETVGSLVVAAGSNVITPSATANVLLSFGGAAGAAYSRSVGGVLTFAAVAPVTPNVQFVNAQTGTTSTAIGTAGGAQRILIGTFLSAGADFAVAGAGVNLQAPTYVTAANIAAIGTVDDNILLTAGGTSTSTSGTINSLKITTAGTAITVGGTLNIRSGMIINTVAGTTIGGGTALTTGGSDYLVNNSATLTISSTLTSAVPLTKAGTSALTLNNASNSITDIYVAAGTVTSSASGSLGTTGTVYLLNGGVINFANSTTQNYTSKGLTVDASGTAIGANNGNWTDGGTAAISSFGGTVALNGYLKVIATGQTALTGNISGIGSLRLVAASRMTLSGDNSAWTGGMTITKGGQVRLDSPNAAGAGTGRIFNGDPNNVGIGIVEFTNNFGTSLTNDLVNASTFDASIKSQQGSGFLISNAKTSAAVTMSGRIASNGLTFQGYDSGTAASETVLSGTVATSGTPINSSYGNTTTIQNFNNGQSGINLGVTAFAASSTTALAYGNQGFLAYNAGTTTGVTNGAEGYVRFAPDASGNVNSLLPGAVGPGYVAALRKGGASTANFGYLLTGASSGSALAGTTASGSNVITGITSTAGYAVGQAITGTNIPGGTTIVRIIDGTSLVLSNNATGWATIADIAISGSGNAYQLPEGKSFVIGTLGLGTGQTGTFGATGTGTNTATFLGNPKAAAGQLLAGFKGGDINIHANAATDTATFNLSARNAGDTLVLGDGVTAANNVVITPTWGDSGASTAVTLLQKRTGATTLKKIGAGTVEIRGLSLTHTDGLNASGAFTWEVNAGTLKLNRAAADNTTILTDGNTATTSDILINGGTLELAASEQIANSGSINMTSGAFNFGAATGKIETIDKFTNSGGTFTTGANTLIGLGHTITWSGGTNTISNGGLVQDVHIVISGGTNTVQGGATGGVLELLALTQAGDGLEMSAGSTLTLNSDNAVAGKLKLNGDVSTSGATTVTIASAPGGANPGNIDLNSGTRTFTVANGAAETDMSISARITNTGSIIKDGAGTLSLDAANDYVGTTTINNGTLIANVLDALPFSTRSAVSFTGGGNPTLSLGASQVAASLNSVSTTTGTVTLGSYTLTVGAASGTTDFKGSIGGAGSLIKDRASTQILSGTNSYTGTTTVSAGTLEVRGSLSGTTAVTVNTSGTLLLNSVATPIIKNTATMTVGGGTVKIADALNGTNQTFGSLTLSGTSILDFGTGSNGNAMTFSSLSFSTTKLNVYNWSGSAYGAGVADTGSVGDGQDHLLFTATTSIGTLGDSRIEFFADGGTTSLGYGQEVAFGGQFELVPITAVPEPATTALIGSIALCALIGYRERRRFTGFGKRMAARK